MKVSRIFFSVFFICFIFSDRHFVVSENILIWAPVSSRSVRLSMTPLIEALAEKGHNITYLAVMEEAEQARQNPKLNIFVPKKWNSSMGSWDHFDFYGMRQSLYGVPKSWYDFREFGILCCEALYTDPEFLEWVKASPKYDLVIVEMSMVNECGFGMQKLFNSKLIVYCTTTVLPGFADAYGLPNESSTLSDITLSLPSGSKMSFLQRFVNALSPILFSVSKNHFYYPKIEEVTRKGWKTLGRKEKVPSFSQVEKSASLVLLTTHYSIDFQRSFPPHVIPVGGAVVEKKMKPLSKEIENFISSANDGFIYMSFGTLVDFRNFEESVQIAFVDALGHFPKIKFVWASASEIGRSLPNNVLVVRWAPQQTLLSHSKIKAFITHAGMGAMAEAIHSSVSMICIPILAEQNHNAHVISTRGAGILLEVVGMKKEQLGNAIEEILTNRRYRDAMARLTKVFHDRPSPPLENAIWWIEYVLRHDNISEYILPPSTQQPWWKRRQIDVWITVGFLISCVILTFIFTICCALNRLLGISLKSNDGERDGKKVKIN